ncbi:MAG: hypothetical protein FWF71_07835 [Actinomycetia bacterium]|nr:hypothetical protein [Actinomycetes bacterium]
MTARAVKLQERELTVKNQYTFGKTVLEKLGLPAGGKVAVYENDRGELVLRAAREDRRSLIRMRMKDYKENYAPIDYADAESTQFLHSKSVGDELID